MLSLFHPIPKPKPGQIRVACVGDSITYGYCVRNRRKNCYPARLGRLLGDGYCVGNFGCSGSTAIENSDLPYMKTRLFRKSLSWNPDIVLLMFGANDSKPQNWNAGTYHRDMKRLIDAYRAMGSRVFLLLPLPVFPINGTVRFGISSAVLESEICPICRALSAQGHVTMIDAHSAFTGHSKLFADGVHPNRQGAETLAMLVNENMKQSQATCLRA